MWRDTPAWAVVERAEAALDRPLAPLLLDPGASLDRTEDAQMAVLVTSLVAWEAVAAELGTPVAFAGHSLGQMTSLIAAGALAFEEGVRLAARRARRTQEAADRQPGEMVALLGASLEVVGQVCQSVPGGCWLANDNAPGQVVIAGSPDAVDAAVGRARALGVRRAVRLPVDGAFHTPLMEEASSAFAEDLSHAAFSPTTVPVVSNGDARAHADGEGWRQRLVDHLVRPVRWRQSVEVLVGLGATELVEVGPGTVLAGLARRIVPGLPARSVEPATAEVPA